jgi:hypothetical protein
MSNNRSPSDEEREGSEQGETGSAQRHERFGRRDCLKLVGSLGLTGLVLPNITNRVAAEGRYDTTAQEVVNMVQDAGCDPTGDEPCDQELRSAAGDDRLLKFPSGTYKLTQRNELLGNSNFSIVGDGSATFKIASNTSEYVVLVNQVNTDNTNILFENIVIDQRARNATPG